MAGTPLAGTKGRVEVGGVAINLNKWSVKPNTNHLPSTNFESVGTDGNTYEEGITSIRKADVSFSGMFDAAANPFSTFNLIPGETVSTVYLYVNKTGNRRFYFAQLIVIDCTVDDDVNDMVKVNFTGKSNGQWVYPV